MEDLFMNDWINILLSAIAGCLLPYLIKILVFLFKRLDKTNICGEWLLYLWWTDSGKTEFVEMNVLIKRGILVNYRIMCKDDASNYKGEAWIEDNNLCINMDASDSIQKSSTYHRYDLSTLEKRDVLYGFWLSFDGDNSVSCGGAFLSRNKINENIDLIIKKHYKINKNVPLMVIKR